MESLTKLKGQLVELEARKKLLNTEMQKTSMWFKVALGVTLIGAVVTVFYSLGFVLLIVGVIGALVYGIRQAKLQDQLEEIKEKIQKLGTSMA